MGDFIKDCSDVIGFSFSWKDDHSIYKLLFTLGAIAAIREIFGSVAKAGMGSSGAGALALAGVLVVGSIVFSLLLAYYSVKVVLSALNKKGHGNIEWNINSFLGYVVFTIIVVVSTLFPWMSTPLLAGSVIIMLGMVATGFFAIAGLITLIQNPGAGTFFGMLGPLAMFFLFLLAGILLWVYVNIRMFPASFKYLSGKSGKTESIKSAWELTRGKFWKIFGTFFVLCLAFFGVWIVVGIGLIVVSIIAVAIDSIVAGNPQGPMSFILGVLLALVLTPLWTFISAYMGVGVYSLLENSGGQAKPESPKK
jgi:hypothetical protein